MHCSSCSGFAVPAQSSLYPIHGGVATPSLLQSRPYQPFLRLVRRELHPNDAFFVEPLLPYQIELHLKFYNSAAAIDPFVPSQRKPYHGTELCLASKTAPSSLSPPFSSRG